MNPGRRAARGTALLVGVVLGFGLASSSSARDLWRRGDDALRLTGSVRQIVTTTQGTDREDFEQAAASDPACLLASTFPDCAAFDVVGDEGVTQSLTRLRLRLDAFVGESFSARLDWDNELRFGNLDTLFSGLRPADTFFGWEEEIHAFGFSRGTGHRQWVTRIYRGFVRWEPEPFEVTVGRQRIAWGVGRIWNPTDRLSFVPPLAIESDQAPGADAIDLRYRLSGMSYVQAVYAAGTSSDEARYALRYQGVVRDVDVSVMAGVFDRARVVGFDLAANLLDAAIRLEAAYTDPRRDVWPIGAPEPRELDDFFQVVVSADTNLPVGTGLYALVEHLYNGNALGFGAGEAGPLLPFFESTDVPPQGLDPSTAAALGGPFVTTASTAIFGSSLVVSGSEHVTALQFSYDLSAALRGDLLTLYDWDGDSAAFFVQLAFNGWDAVELAVGVQAFAGKDRSEYGGRDPLVFVQGEWFF